MTPKSEKEKMLAGELYVAADPQLVRERNRARRLTRLYNQTEEDEVDKRRALLEELLGDIGENVMIEPPFFCDYGSYITIGAGSFMNFNCVILDCNTIDIGRNVMMGPAVQIYAAYHPIDAAQRILGPELAAPVKIGNNVWLGGGVIICQGVTVGDNTTIGAGSVVVRDIPANVFAAGNPCRMIRPLSPP